VLGSAPVFSGFLKKLIPVVNVRTKIMCLYGMTEILPVTYIDGRKKIGLHLEGDVLGKPIPGIHVSLSRDNELLVKAKHQAERYYNQKKMDLIATGDIVQIIDKYIVLKGRKKDMIIKGNYNIYPELYESTIQKIPGVIACAMVGIYSTKLEDEKILLVVEGKPGISKKLKIALREGANSIDIHAQPDSIIEMTIPRFGRQRKIDKKKIREMYSTL
jgi:acyl-CoA synthetase (AMP-forming)/AMP-acid ligase II